jgi:Arv1-like family
MRAKKNREKREFGTNISKLTTTTTKDVNQISMYPEPGGLFSSMVAYLMSSLISVASFGSFALAVSVAVLVHVRLSSAANNVAIFNYNYLVMTLVLSSFGKALILLTMIWGYPPQFIVALNMFVATSNTVALRAFLECSQLEAILLVGTGYLFMFLCRFAISILMF